MLLPLRSRQQAAEGMRQRFRAHRQAGFTLVELAIVLAVIGLIIGAVAIGKDVQRNAEYTKIKNKFIDQWEQAYNQYYNQYYQRTGVVLGDSQTQPRLMVNGVQYTAAAGAPTSGGNMTGVTSPGAICREAGPANAALGGGALALPGTTQTTLRDLFLRVGVRMPPGRAEGFEDRYVYLDSNGNPQEIQVCFLWQPPGTPSGAGNVMVITGLTPDLARSIDQMVDGKPDAREGRFRQFGVTQAAGEANVPGIEWTVNNTYQIGAAATTANTNGLALDEDQVFAVAGVLKMNQ